PGARGDLADKALHHKVRNQKPGHQRESQAPDGHVRYHALRILNGPALLAHDDGHHQESDYAHNHGADNDARDAQVRVELLNIVIALEHDRLLVGSPDFRSIADSTKRTGRSSSGGRPGPWPPERTSHSSQRWCA